MIDLSQFFLKLFDLLFLFLNYPNILCINPDSLAKVVQCPSLQTHLMPMLMKMWLLLESLCFSRPLTIVDEQCKVNLIVGVLI
jgi:hypothetical protein